MHPGEIIAIWNGGIAIYGGIIGALIGAKIGCRVGKINFQNLLDLGALGLLIGQGIGRWGISLIRRHSGAKYRYCTFPYVWSLKSGIPWHRDRTDLLLKRYGG